MNAMLDALDASVLEKFENEHLKYEWTMFANCHTLQRGGKRLNSFEANLYHECFCVHAWNLMNYLPKYEYDDSEYLKLIEGQILTLTQTGRTMINKIDHNKREEMALQITSRYARYCKE